MGYGPDWGMMGGWGASWWGPLHMIFWILILVAVIVGIVWFVRSLSHGGPTQSYRPSRSPGLDVLEERYARGELNRDEYLQKKRDISG